ncbi:(2Fe-2S)-binding protein [Kushneria phosphatilytica]|uniref:(2Fe-2S)-binding protein n=1 Tax=Kushneria phosphatilytica TaxID=657387 RepID=A0A5C0ZTP5_9GAMM|nr:(2Fe-2S)-binding protein [Kushneria phosphatilytica]QEL09890.1 (2Fe-2S)-binding protein [Kushneria phosphatilytica]
MFRLHDDHGERIALMLDERPVEVPPGLSVAAALLWLDGAAGYRRHLADGAPRAPWCMMGVCHDCLVEIDGRPNRQGCLETVVPGMRLRRQRLDEDAP